MIKSILYEINNIFLSLVGCGSSGNPEGDLSTSASTAVGAAAEVEGKVAAATDATTTVPVVAGTAAAGEVATGAVLGGAVGPIVEAIDDDDQAPTAAESAAAALAAALDLVETDNLRIIPFNRDSFGSSIFNIGRYQTFIHDFNAEDETGKKFNAGNDGIKWGLSSSSRDIFDHDTGESVFIIDESSGVLNFTSSKYTNSYYKTQFIIDISATSADEVAMHKVVIHTNPDAIEMKMPRTPPPAPAAGL